MIIYSKIQSEKRIFQSNFSYNFSNNFWNLAETLASDAHYEALGLSAAPAGDYPTEDEFETDAINEFAPAPAISIMPYNPQEREHKLSGTNITLPNRIKVFFEFTRSISNKIISQATH